MLKQIKVKLKIVVLHSRVYSQPASVNCSNEHELVSSCNWTVVVTTNEHLIHLFLLEGPLGKVRFEGTPAHKLVAPAWWSFLISSPSVKFISFSDGIPGVDNVSWLLIFRPFLEVPVHPLSLFSIPLSLFFYLPEEKKSVDGLSSRWFLLLCSTIVFV